MSQASPDRDGAVRGGSLVVNLISISLLRELGPLLAAVILAGRTGWAFAAEIGTMKVNEEIDALTACDIPSRSVETTFPAPSPLPLI